MEQVGKNLPKVRATIQKKEKQPNQKADCPFGCQDGWLVGEGKTDAGKLYRYTKRCQCLLGEIERHKFKNLMKASQVDGLEHMTFATYKPRHKTQEKALNIMLQRHGSFFLCGPWGTGKTHLLTASIIRAISQGIQAVKISVPSLLREMRKFGREERTNIEALAWEIPYLALDDIGKQKDTDWTDERMFELVDRRYSGFVDGKTNTSITSNNTLTELKDKIDGATLDRIQGMCQKLFMDGPSFRTRKET